MLGGANVANVAADSSRRRINIQQIGVYIMKNIFILLILLFPSICFSQVVEKNTNKSQHFILIKNMGNINFTGDGELYLIMMNEYENNCCRICCKTSCPECQGEIVNVF